MNRNRLIATLVTLAGLALSDVASATSICVANTADLRNALLAWQVVKDQTFQIKLVQGTYAYTQNDYWSQPYYGGNAKLELLGGYTTNCASRSVVASNTTIDGQHVQYSQFQLFGAGSMLVEGITFKRLDRNVSFVSDSSDAADSVVVRYVVGTDLFGAASALESFGGFQVGGSSNIRVESSLFYDIHGGDTAGGLEVIGDGDNAVAVVTNVTSAYNDSRGLQVVCRNGYDFGSCAMFVYNTILYNNKSGDFDSRYLLAGSPILVAYSDFDPAKSVGSYTPAGNINADPKFENPLNNDFLLLNNSPALNVGAPENLVQGGYGSQDIAGGVRVIGSHVDLGAYESIVNDQVAQTVSANTDDVFNATLRAAINTANSNANATPINFNLGDAASCPQVINLTTPLPDITTDVTINGVSEPGSKENTQYAGYDGRICLILRASGSVAHALRVSGSGRLTLKGVEFEGFSTAAIRLAAGNGSIVTGNGFAAVPGSAANGAGVRIEGSANYSQIGALSPNDRNVFDQGSYGVDFENNGLARSNVVEGNYFGFNFDGTPWSGPPTTYGIYMAGSGGNTIGYNTIGNMNSNGIRLTGANTTANTFVANGIGIAPNGASAGNGNAGIGIAASAHANVIGTAAFQTQSGGGNYIVNNFGPGVWIENTAGAGNRVDGNNVIHDNDGFLAVDLGAAGDAFGLGPTANDADDVDTGPNSLQNYPTLTEAKRIEAKTIVVSGYALPEPAAAAHNYRIDLFWTDTCTASGPEAPRGEMKRYVGFFSLPVAANSHFVPWSQLKITAPASIPGTGYLFATETDASGNTSEPGKCFTFNDDYIFSNGFN